MQLHLNEAQEAWEVSTRSRPRTSHLSSSLRSMIWRPFENTSKNIFWLLCTPEVSLNISTAELSAAKESARLALRSSARTNERGPDLISHLNQFYDMNSMETFTIRIREREYGPALGTMTDVSDEEAGPRLQKFLSQCHICKDRCIQCDKGFQS